MSEAIIKNLQEAITRIEQLQMERDLAYEEQGKLQAENEHWKQRYIEAVNDFAQMKRSIRKCKCPDCGFNFEQALKGE